MLVLYLLSLIFELLLYAPWLWRIKKPILIVILIVTSFSATGLFFGSPNIVNAGLVVLAAFRIFNLLRIVKVRMHPAYLYRACRRTSIWLLVYHAIFLLGALALTSFLDPQQLFAGIVFLQLIVSVFVLCTTIWNIKKTKYHYAGRHFADKELPTVTVAIPARNETSELEDCLRSVLASNYPKLEIIVLDDQSHDKTPDIIKGFAHDGVRFLPGDEPAQRWLAKNQAYEKLSKEASGELVLFCGVDVRFGPETVRALVTALLDKKKDMISILPRRLTGNAFTAFIQPMRYWWELALPRRPFNRPPVLSTCWIIRRKALEELGDFEAVSHSIIPEGYFARELVKADRYSFIRADDTLDVQTRKSLRDQQETAMRTRYPQARRRPEWVLGIALAEWLFLFVPFAIVATTLWSGFGVIYGFALATCVLLIMTHVYIVQISNPANLLIALINFPIVVLTELLLGLDSMYLYEFSVITWKERDITEPVMHVVPRLPKI